MVTDSSIEQQAQRHDHGGGAFFRARGTMAKRMAPFLKDGQIIVLHPGHLAPSRWPRCCAIITITADVTVSEAETFGTPHVPDGPAQARIFPHERGFQLPLAALPATPCTGALTELRSLPAIHRRHLMYCELD